MTFRDTARLMGSQRRLLVPFFIVAFVQALFIGLAWLAPQPPFSILLAPPVRYFYGERVLHYPWHLWFLYFSMKHAHLFTSLVLGAFMSGVACAMVQRIHQQSSLTVHEVLATGSVRYGRMAILWLATWGLAKGLMTAMEQFAPRTPWMLWTAIGAMVVLQALFAYAIPASVFEGSPWWKALWQSLRETGRYPLSTLLVVLPPSAAVIAFSITATPNRLAQWMAHTAPEIAVALVAARLLVWTLADAVLTVGLCHLWWFHRTPAVVLESAGKAIPEVTGKPLSRGAVTA